MKYRVLYVQENSILNWQDCDTLIQCRDFSKSINSDVDVYVKDDNGFYCFYCSISVGN